MVKQLLWVISFVSIVSLVSVPFFQQPMPIGRFRNLMTITGEGIADQKIVDVKVNCEGTGEAVLTYPTSDQTSSEIVQGTSYAHRPVGLRQVEVDATDCENTRAGISFTQRKLMSKFHSRRWIPGGPDAQHHGSNG